MGMVLLASVQSVLINVGGTAGIVGLAGGCWWLANRIEPHRIARDQSWFTCKARVLDVGRPVHAPTTSSMTADRLWAGMREAGPKTGSWSEARVFFRDDGSVELIPRSRRGQSWFAPIATASDEAKGRLRYYSLETNPLVEFRIPSKSKVRDELDRRITR
jgi:hypothetical protein